MYLRKKQDNAYKLAKKNRLGKFSKRQQDRKSNYKKSKYEEN